MDPGPSASPTSGALVLRQTDPWLVARDRFLEDLTPEEKVIFIYASPENLFYKTSNAEREHKDSSKMRAVSQRLEPLVAVIQEYGKAMDVYSNASPAILCPLWGSIRVLMVLAQTYGKFFDMIVEELQHIGKVLPRLNVYKELYPQYGSLRQALTTAYLDVITICTRYRRFLREQKTAKKFLVALSPRSTKSFKSSIDTFKKHEENVRMEVDICHQIEAKKTTDMLLADREREMQAVKENRRRRLLSVLSSVNVEGKHERIRKSRHPDSCKWIFSTTEYQSWINSAKSAVLCCDGIPGCGKSVLASSAVENLTSLKSESTSIAYYYCDYAEKISLDPAIILGTVIRSLLTKSNDITEEVAGLVHTFYQDGERTPDADEVLGILIKVMEISPQVLLVLDGIDEMDERNFYSVLSLLKELLSAQNVVVKLFVTSREHKDLLSVLSPGRGVWHQIHVDQRLISNDIEAYILHSVESLMVSKRLIFNTSHTEVMQEITQRLIEGANGMFLWVKYQLDELCLAECEQTFVDTLRNLPGDLDETYRRLLDKIEKQSERKERTQRMFEWIIAARRPLTEVELSEGMSFTIEDRHWNHRKIPFDLSRIIRAGGNLVVFDKATGTIRLAHHTVKQYLLRDIPNRYHFSVERANQSIAETCIAYLCFEDFERNLVKYADSGIKAALKPLEMLASPNSPSRNKLDPLVIRHRLGFSRDISFLDVNHNLGISPRRTPVQNTFDKLGLLEYARTYWLCHSTKLQPALLPDRREILFQDLVTEKKLPFNFRPWPDISLKQPYPHILGWAMDNDHAPLIRSLMQYDKQFTFEECVKNSAQWFFKSPDRLLVTAEMLQTISSCNFDIWNPAISTEGWIYHKMLTAAQRGNIAVLKLCHSLSNSEMFPWKQLRSHLIIEAAATNQVDIIQMYANGILPAKQTSFWVVYKGYIYNALERAALSGHTAMVHRLGNTGWETDNLFDAKLSLGFDLFDKAINQNDGRLVRALLMALLFANSESSQEITAHGFCAAVSSGHIGLVEIFLDYDIDPTAPNISGICPYMQAIRDGDLEIFFRLYPLTGCGVGGNFTGAPLTMAAAHDRIEIANFLVSEGACVDEEVLYRTLSGSDSACPTPLYAASVKGHCAIVKLLLASGAGAGIRSYKRWEPRINGKTTNFDRQLKIHDILVYPESCLLAPEFVRFFELLDSRQEPLMAASCTGHLEVVKMLLNAGASVNPEKPHRDHPLLMAAMGNHYETVDLLLACGGEIHPDNPNALRALLACSVAAELEKTFSPTKIHTLGLLIKCGVDVQVVDEKGYSALHFAVESDTQVALKRLIHVGANVNAGDHQMTTPMMLACKLHRLKVANILLAADADLRARDKDGVSALSHITFSKRAEMLESMLLEACLLGKGDIVMLLLRNKANIYARTKVSIRKFPNTGWAKEIPKGSTPLMIASLMDDVRVITVLLHFDRRTLLELVEPERGCTSIHLAAESGNWNAFFKLAESGADLGVRGCSDSVEFSLLDSAIIGQNGDIVMDLLKRHEIKLEEKLCVFSKSDLWTAKEKCRILSNNLSSKLEKGADEGRVSEEELFAAQVTKAIFDEDVAAKLYKLLRLDD